MTLDMAAFRELYEAESGQYLRLLGRALLALEEGRPEAVNEALRAAHTLKGMAAAMGFEGVAHAAHALEERLVALRDGGTAADSGAVDALLAGADAVESAVRQSLVAGTGAEGEEGGDGRRISVSAARIDDLADRAAELTVLHARAASVPPDEFEARHLSRLVAELQRGVQALRMAPLSEAFERLPRAVRDAARQLEREADLELHGGEVEIDRPILDALGDPLLHLVRNAVAHGIEAPAARRARGKRARGRVTVSALAERGSVLLTVADDGAGIDRAAIAARPGREEAAPADDDDALLRLLSRPGFSTAQEVTGVAGRGVGLDMVVTRVRAVGGAIELRTVPGEGTTFSIRLPLTLSTAQALLVRIGTEEYAIPVTHIIGAVEVPAAAEFVRLHERSIRLIRLREVLRVPEAGVETAAVVAELGDRRAALAVDEIVGTEQIVVRPFAATRDSLPVFSSVTVRADGRPTLVLDPLSVL
jgi:two-component system, chemotaxis family, sensor kinase CheA